MILLLSFIITEVALFFKDSFHFANDQIAAAQFLSQRVLRSLRLAYDDEIPIKWDGKVGDKVIVMAHTRQEDPSWVKEKLPE